MKKLFISKIFAVLLVSALMLFSFSCGRKSKLKEKVSVGYNVYEPSVKLDSEGNADTLYISFDGSVAKLEDANGKPSSEITITPAIAGKWTWVNDDGLRFIPFESWLLDTKYKVVMPDAIFSDSVQVKNEFTFKTEPFSVSLPGGEFYINPEDPSEKRVTATLYASHPMVKDSVKKAVSMSLLYLDSKGKTSKTDNINFQVSFNKALTEAYLVSDLLPIPPYTSDLKITLSKGIQTQIGGTSSNEDSSKVTIHGMSDFVRINDISSELVKNESQNFDQMLIIETKGSVAVEELERHLEVYELPLDRPEMEGWEASKKYSWSTTYVTETLLKDYARKLSVEPIPTHTLANFCVCNSFITDFIPL